MSEDFRQLVEFVKLLGRAMGQMSLYGAKHPSVAESIAGAHERALELLSGSGPAEFAVSVDKDNLLFNGKVAAPAGQVPSALLNVLGKLDVASLNFAPGLSKEELAALCELALLKEKNADTAQAFLREKGVSRIRLNASFYAKIENGQQVVSGSAQEGSAEKAAASVEQKLKDKSVEESLEFIVGQMNLSRDEKLKVMQLVMEQFKEELELRVKTATEQIRRDKKIVENEHLRTDNVFSSSAEGVVVVDETGRILMMNSAAEDIFGKKLSELAGKAITDISGTEEQLLAISRELSTPQDNQISAGIIIKGDDELVRAHRQATAIIRSDTGKIVGSASVPPDVAKLKEVDRLQREFVANVTHELRSPLTSITVALELLNSDSGKFASEQKQFLTTAMRNAQRLNSIIGDILDFSKLQSGKLVVHPQENDPRAIASDAVESMQAWAGTKRLKLRFNSAQEVPNVFADKERTVQALVNLISNAIKFTPEGGSIEVAVSKETRNGGDHVVFSVKDTGPGIPKQDQERIFERFVQIASGEKVGGTGLGLPITKALVIMQNGRIELDSAPGKGSCFKISLPASKGLSPEETIRQLPKPQSPKPWWRRIFG